MNKLIALILLSRAITGFGETYNVTAGSSDVAIQDLLDNAAPSSVVVFAPGIYNIDHQIKVPCTSDLTLAGPVATPSTAVLSSTYAHSFIMATGAACSVPVTITYLGFNGNRPSAGGGGGIYVPANTSNLTITHNTLQGNQGVNGSGGEAAMGLIWLDGTNPGTTDSNIAVTWNQLGSPGDCSNIMSVLSDQGGYCEGLGIHTDVDGGTFSDNTIYYQEEGIKVWEGNAKAANCASCVFENNDFSNIHRIGFESQVNPVPEMTVQFNSYHDPFAPFYYTFGLSAANGETQTTNTDFNVVAANVPPEAGEYIAMAIEVWGSGSTAMGNLVEGYWANGIQYNHLGNFSITNNIICGPGTPGSGMTYIDAGNTLQYEPVENNNLMQPTCPAFVSTAPKIDQSGTTITLSDTGINHSVYFTTDGSTPTASSTLYTVPFTVASNTTIRAIGMWGQGGNAKSYPTGYGYSPSGVVSAVYTGVAAPTPPPASTKRLVAAYLEGTGRITTVAVGRTLQFKAFGVYSDGSVETLPDSQGNAVTAWNTSDHSVAKISMGGHVTAMGVGTVEIEAAIGRLKASIRNLTVIETPVPGAQ